MAEVDIGAAQISKIRLDEQAGDPASPAVGYGYLYCKPEGVFFKDDNGEVVGPFGFGIVPGGRLTLETGVPVSTSAQSAKTALYYTPYKHNVISLYSNSKWNPVQFTEKTITVIGLTASRVYDVFGYLNAGTLALELLIWTDATNRATALAYQDGILIKSGNATRRYLGTICINSTGGQTEDTETQRFVWNYYNRVWRVLNNDDGSSHTYATATWRAWNNDSGNIVEVVIGVEEDVIQHSVHAQLQAGADNRAPAVGLGEDTTAAAVSAFIIESRVAQIMRITASFPWSSTEGYHYFALVEIAQSALQSTFLYAGVRSSISG